MSYATSLFAVDLDELSRIIAEHDTSVVQQVKDSEPEQFDKVMYDGDPTLGEALTQIVLGSDKDAAHSHQYGYALKLLCQVIGEWLPDDDMIADLEPLELNSPLEQYRLPIDIPANKDFPFISFLTAAEVKGEAERLAAMDLDFADDEDIAEARDAYATCLATAAENGKAVVSFYS